jgi:regulator of sigma D
MDYQNILKDVNGNEFEVVTMLNQNYLNGVKIDKIKFNFNNRCFNVILDNGKTLEFKELPFIIILSII